MSVHRRGTKRGARYDVRLRTPEGRSYKRTFRSRREANAYEAQELADRSRGTWQDPIRSATTFKAWAEQWLAFADGRRPKTVAWYNDVVDLHLVPVLGHRPLGSLTPVEVQRLVNGLGTRFAPTTTRGYYAVLRAILNAAVNADLIGRSPCRGIRLPTGQAKERMIIGASEVHLLANAIGERFQAMVLLAAELGLRWGECAGLQVRDLDVLRRSVTIRRNVGEVRGVLIIGEPKTAAGARTVAASAPLMAELAEHLRRRGMTAENGEAWLFEAPMGGPLRYSSFRSRLWKPAVRAAGLNGFTFHGLRHSAATVWVASGVDPKTAQHRLGQSTPRLVLELYAHATSDADRAAANFMGDHLFPRADDPSTRVAP